MGIVQEESAFTDFDVTLSVVSREQDEVRDPWKFISIDFDSNENLSPKELRDLGKWLYNEGRRLGQEYKSNGEPKFPKE